VRLLALALILTAVGPAVGPAVAPATAAPRDARLRRVHTWAFAIGNGALRGTTARLARRYRAYDLVIVDGEATTRAQIRALRRRGTIVLAYLDVGAIESYRSWYRRAKPYRLDFWGNWGEWYASTAKAGYRRLIAHDVAPPMLAKGFDGLFLDNTDMISGHPRQAHGMRVLVRSLSRLVHARGDLLFAQNGEEVVGPILRHLDGWNREDVTRTYDFTRRRYVPVPRGAAASARRALRRVAKHGVLVTATDYVRRGDARGTAASVRNACAAGALPFVSDIGLSRVPATPARCP
jgi:endo-alpha-1,4-polygalactosaminidase (GH114 family)